jgi:hypothetical protein
MVDNAKAASELIQPKPTASDEDVAREIDDLHRTGHDGDLPIAETAAIIAAHYQQAEAAVMAHCIEVLDAVQFTDMGELPPLQAAYAAKAIMLGVLEGSV